MNANQPNTNTGQVLNILNSGADTSRSDVVINHDAPNPEEVRRYGDGVAFDPAHKTILRGPHLLANKFQSYTDWLTDIHNPQMPAAVDKITGETDESSDETVEPPVAQSSKIISDEPADPHLQLQATVLNTAKAVDRLAAKLRRPSQYTGTGFQKIRSALAAWETEVLAWPAELEILAKLSGNAIGQLAKMATRQGAATQQRLLFSGVTRQSGTTTIMAGVGRNLAANGKRVLLVDADLEHPDLSNRLRLNDMLSWLDAAKLQREASHFIVREMKSNLFVMPLARFTKRVGWPKFMLDTLGELVDQVKHRFDAILIDVGPGRQLLRELSSSQLLIDTAIVVNNIHQVPRGSFEQYRQSLRDFGIQRIVVADNFASAKRESSPSAPNFGSTMSQMT